MKKVKGSRPSRSKIIFWPQSNPDLFWVYFDHKVSEQMTTKGYNQINISLSLNIMRIILCIIRRESWVGVHHCLACSFALRMSLVPRTTDPRFVLEKSLLIVAKLPSNADLNLSRNIYNWVKCLLCCCCELWTVRKIFQDVVLLTQNLDVIIKEVSN